MSCASISSKSSLGPSETKTCLQVAKLKLLMFETAKGKLPLSMTDSSVDILSTDESVIDNGNFPFAVSNISSFNFATCKQVFVSDGPSDDFELIDAQLIGKLSCDVDFENSNSEAGGKAQLIQGSPSP